MKNNNKPSTLRRYIQIIYGLLFLAISLFIIFISIVFILNSLDPLASERSITGVIVGSLMLVGTILITVLKLPSLFNKQAIMGKNESYSPKVFFGIIAVFVIFGITVIFTDFFAKLFESLEVETPKIFTFIIGMHLTMYFIIKLYWVLAVRKAKDYDLEQEELLGFLWIYITALIIYSFLVMVLLAYLFKPLSLDIGELLLAGSITGSIIIIVWVSYNAVLNILKVSNEAWPTKLLRGSPFIIVSISLSVLYYFFS